MLISGVMITVADIFSDLGGPAAVARELGIGKSTASEMKRRGSIPTEYWHALIGMARSRGLRHLDPEALVSAHARPGRHRASTHPAKEGPDGTAEHGGRRDGHFSRFYERRQPHFSTIGEIGDHVAALRDEWEHR